jgi:hypothetical protein
MRIKGVITDADSGSPIAGAVVTSDCYDRSAVSDPMGRYDLKTRLRDTCTVSAGAPGYHTVMATITSGHPVADISLRRSYQAWGNQLGPLRTADEEPTRQENVPRRR